MQRDSAQTVHYSFSLEGVEIQTINAQTHCVSSVIIGIHSFDKIIADYKALRDQGFSKPMEPKRTIYFPQEIPVENRSQYDQKLAKFRDMLKRFVNSCLEDNERLSLLCALWHNLNQYMNQEPKSNSPQGGSS